MTWPCLGLGDCGLVNITDLTIAVSAGQDLLQASGNRKEEE